jgi:PAT family beta-lactamase induction signal transducer AmpG
VAAFGFAAGLPYYLVGSTLTAWMATAGVDLATIGVFALASLPYSFKFVWAPLLDRFVPPFLGRRRGWMAVFQVALAGGLATMAMCDPKGSLRPLAIAAVMTTFFAASHDIAVDAYRTELLPDRERGPGAGVYVSGYRIAMIATGAGALLLAGVVPWPTVYWIYAGLMLAIAVFTFVAPEPETPARPPRSLGEAVVRPFVDLVLRPDAVRMLALVASFKIGEIVVAWVQIPFLLHVGYAREEVALLGNALGMGATAVGAILGGLAVPRLGERLALVVFGAAGAVTNLLYLAVALSPPNQVLLGGAIAVDNLAAGLVNAAFVAYLMSLCRPGFSAAQYALLSSLSGLLGRVLTPRFTSLAADSGWPMFFAATVALAIPALVLAALPERQARRA